jgi:hypothetical protein
MMRKSRREGLMSHKRRPLHRKLGELRYRKVFIIATEGEVTEPEYFLQLNNKQYSVQILCLKPSNSHSPLEVLTQLKIHLKKEALRKSDEAWLVIDRDNWAKKDLAVLHKWAKTRSNYGFALSNPKFEYWLLLHFEDGLAVSNSLECSVRLRQYWSNYNKHIDPRKITTSGIHAAVSRAQQMDCPRCRDWPRTTGTTVYRLVGKILNI